MGRPPKNNLPVDLQKILHDVGANLAALRAERKLSLAALSGKSKISVTTINEIESRRFRDIRLSTIVALAKGLNVPPLQILKSNEIKLKDTDQSRLLKAGEDILRIAKTIHESETNKE